MSRFILSILPGRQVPLRILTLGSRSSVAEKSLIYQRRDQLLPFLARTVSKYRYLASKEFAEPVSLVYLKVYRTIATLSSVMPKKQRATNLRHVVRAPEHLFWS
ncbi:hypothetical protein D9M70_572100 [compost metagenome]